MFLTFNNFPSTLIQSTVSDELQLAHVSLEFDVCIRSFDIRSIDFVLMANTHLMHICFSQTDEIGNNSSLKLAVIRAACALTMFQGSILVCNACSTQLVGVTQLCVFGSGYIT
jgi:hypothetical protein